MKSAFRHYKSTSGLDRKSNLYLWLIIIHNIMVEIVPQVRLCYPPSVIIRGLVPKWCRSLRVRSPRFPVPLLRVPVPVPVRWILTRRVLISTNIEKERWWLSLRGLEKNLTGNNGVGCVRKEIVSKKANAADFAPGICPQWPEGKTARDRQVQECWYSLKYRNCY